MILVFVLSSIISPNLTNYLTHSRYAIYICEFMRIIDHSVSLGKSDHVTHALQVFYSFPIYVLDTSFVPAQMILSRSITLTTATGTRSVQMQSVSHCCNLKATCRCKGINCLWSHLKGMGHGTLWITPPRRPY